MDGKRECSPRITETRSLGPQGYVHDFFDAYDPVCQICAPKGQTITGYFYAKIVLPEIHRVAVGMEFQSPSHSHRISVGISTKTHRTHRKPHKNPQKPTEPTCGNTHRLKVIPIPIPIPYGNAHGKTHRFPIPRQPWRSKNIILSVDQPSDSKESNFYTIMPDHTNLRR